ncbi:unnamed protein product [Schistocephalus solidus]|uniref:Endo/exonuclease/phosphatase domain-containing protein n=1 Tax=Schistocephalus solidus TaxID=70667 RepID=A0A183SFV8_SCHSO|nr:unnamed protein product [Schistocephalus solidus]
MLLWPPLTGTQLSPVAPRSWAPLSDRTLCNRHDQRSKPGEGIRCCVRLQPRYIRSIPPLPFSLPFAPIPSYLPITLSFPHCLSVKPNTYLFPPRSKTSAGEGGCWLHLLLERPAKGRATRRWRHLCHLERHRWTTALSATGSVEAKDKFYEDIHALLVTVPKADKFIVIGDFNASVGTDHVTWSRVFGPHGLASFNDSGLLLLQTYAEHRLILTNTFFCILMRQKATWVYPRSRHWHLLDNGLVNRLANLPVADEENSVEKRGCQPKDMVQSTTLDVLDRTRRQHQDWFDNNDAAINALLTEKNRRKTIKKHALSQRQG